MYVSVPFVAIFGLNEWGVRLPTVFFGVLSIFLLFKLVKILSKSNSLALWSAFVLAITPWHLHYSRAAFEVTLLLALILGGTIVFLKGKWSWSALLFSLSFYTYNTANLFVPLFLLTLLLLAWKSKKAEFSKKKLIRAGLVFLVASLPIVLTIARGQGSARFRQISIFSDQKTVGKIVYKRTTGISQGQERFFHNKLLAWGNNFLSNYSGFVSPQFLFFTGDPNPRHNQPGFGQFLLVLAPFFVLGLEEWGRFRDRFFKKIILFWLVLGPIATALTEGGGFHATRLFIVLPPLVILTAIGLNWFFTILKGRLRAALFVLILISLGLNMVLWFHNYLVHYPKEAADYWNYGYKEAFTWLQGNEQVERIFINNHHEPALTRYLFWSRLSPLEFQGNFVNDSSVDNLLPDFDGFQLGNVYFGGIDSSDRVNWFKNNLEKGDVYLAIRNQEVPFDQDRTKETPGGIEIKKVVYDPWGEPLMYWLTKGTEWVGD